MTDRRRAIPSTDVLLRDPRFAAAAARVGRATVKAVVVAAQNEARSGRIAPEQVVDIALAGMPDLPCTLRPVINATGILIHTNLGRAPLSDVARDAVAAVAGTTDVELDLATGRRGGRGRGAIEALLDVVPEAEAAHVVNNTAGALLLCALALARDKQILISRGELVEIGDGFRIPELLASTGVGLREVGTTNRTRVTDFADAIDERTGLILRVHPSNFSITGFAGTPAIADVTELGVPVVADIGSGLLKPHPLLPDEPDATSALRAGASLVTASGDKLLGGPQAGIVLGTRTFVEQLRRHPSARALRVDKMTLAALEATLRGPATPTTVALETPVEELEERAKKLVECLRSGGVDARWGPSCAMIGGGGAPGVELPSVAVGLPERYATPLRTGGTAVQGRVEGGDCLLDLCAVQAAYDDAVIRAVLEVHGQLGLPSEPM